MDTSRSRSIGSTFVGLPRSDVAIPFTVEGFRISTEREVEQEGYDRDGSGAECRYLQLRQCSQVLETCPGDVSYAALN